MIADTTTDIEEFSAIYINGWLALFFWLLLAGGIAFGAISSFSLGHIRVLDMALAGLLLFLAKGFNIIPPNRASVLTFAGKYSGTIRDSGFVFCNPLASRTLASLRINNFTTEIIKVNDKAGNPIEIASVISWRIQDTAMALFAVSDCESYVRMACESAIREVTSSHNYDHSANNDSTEKTLRGDLDGVADLLEKKVGEHVKAAGIEIISAKITHLAYAPEIAMAMLRRQQAAAVISARQLIVTGAVCMVRSALKEIEALKLVVLDDREKASLVTNLLTVLVSESETQPVISLGK